MVFCDKKARKKYEGILSEIAEHNHLGTETVAGADIETKIVDDYNPHILIWVNGVRSDIDFCEVVKQIKEKRPNLRIIYVHGEVTDKVAFELIANSLLQSKVFDVLISDSKLAEVIRKPMTYDDFKATISCLQTEENLQEVKSGVGKSTDNFGSFETFEMSPLVKPLSFDWLAEQDDSFDFDGIVTIADKNAEISEENHVTIGLVALLHRSGCTHASFELAVLLAKKKKKVCVIVTDKNTYFALAKFYGITANMAENGFTIKKIAVFPYSKIDEVADLFDFIVCDFGYICRESELHRKRFASSTVKIMLCSTSEWDCTPLTQFINYPTASEQAYFRDISYCFYPISQSRFIAYNRQMLGGGFKAYRLGTSKHWLNPCAENIRVFETILRRYLKKLP